jgi:hypothetical protein
MIRTTIAALAALALAAPAAQAAPDRTLQLDDATLTQKASSTPASGVNTSYFEETAAPGACTKNPNQYCETTLIAIGEETTKKSLTVKIDGFQTTSDFDLRVYKAKADGTKQGAWLGSPTAEGNGPFNAVLPTFFGDFESYTVSNVKKGTFYLVEVVYFAVVNDKYDITATLK